MIWVNTPKWIDQYKEKPILVITFDDGYATALEVAMDNRGIKATSFIITSKVGTEERLTWEQIKVLRGRNWDTECHTHTHPRLAEVSESVIREEMENVNSAFLSQGLPTPKHHANPEGSTTETVRSILDDYRETQRAGLGGPYTFDEIDFRQLGTIGMDIQTTSKLDAVKQTIKQAYAQNKILLGYLHQLEDEPSGYHSRCVKEYFWDMVDYAMSLGINIWTIDDMYNYVRFINNELTE